MNIIISILFSLVIFLPICVWVANYFVDEKNIEQWQAVVILFFSGLIIGAIILSISKTNSDAKPGKKYLVVDYWSAVLIPCFVFAIIYGVFDLLF